jgi:hypothetical protein
MKFKTIESLQKRQEKKIGLNLKKNKKIRLNDEIEKNKKLTKELRKKIINQKN